MFPPSLMFMCGKHHEWSVQAPILDNAPFIVHNRLLNSLILVLRTKNKTQSLIYEIFPNIRLLSPKHYEHNTNNSWVKLFFFLSMWRNSSKMKRAVIHLTGNVCVCDFDYEDHTNNDFVNCISNERLTWVWKVFQYIRCGKQHNSQPKYFKA